MSQVSCVLTTGLLLAACGSGGSATPTSTTLAATSTSPATTTTAATTSTTAAPTTAAPTTTTEFDPAQLPGRILMQGASCGDDLSAWQQQMGGSQSPEEIMKIADEMRASIQFQICVLNLDGSGPVLVSPKDKFAISPGWIDGGKRIIFRMDGRWYVVNPDGSNLEPWTDPTILPWRLSPDGTKYINQSVHDQRVYVTPVGQERDGPGRRAILDDAFGDTFRWSPDSRFVLFTTGDSNCPELWKVDVTTLEQFPLTGPKSVNRDSGFCSDPNWATWSPDGSAIMAFDYEGMQPDTHPYLMDPDGGNLRRLVTTDFFDDPDWFAVGAAWSPDGKYVFVDVLSTPAMVKQELTRLIVRVEDGLVKPINWFSPVVIPQVMWAPDAPELKPDPDEDMDAV